MKVKEIHFINEDDGDSLEIEVNGQNVISVYPLWECPEDAYLHRSLSFAYDITGLMEGAYEAGKNGEKFELEVEEKKEK